MPLIVKPNVRRMRQFRDSPSETSVPRSRGFLAGLRWERIALVVAVLIGVAFLALHH